MNDNLTSMSNKSILTLSVVVAIIILLPYILVFKGTTLSQSSMDWGAFGNYAGISISIFSIALIYITYDEQKKSNKIARFEQHFKTMISTLSNFVEKNNELFEVVYNKFSQHFIIQFDDLSKCERNKTINVCKEYYSSIMFDRQNVFNYIFHYFDLTVDFISQERSITDDEKSCRITEMICVLPESMRVLFLFWVLQNKNYLLKKYYENGIFTINEIETSFLQKIITFICTGNRPQQRESAIINPNNIELELGDYSEEQFHDTYDRMYNNNNNKT